MLVLDEQLMGRGLEIAIARWYRGRILYINELRPHTVIKDEAIPFLLRTQRSPTFITINTQDFWQRIAVDRRFCVTCFALADAQIVGLDQTLRLLLRHPRFCTKALLWDA